MPTPFNLRDNLWARNSNEAYTVSLKPVPLSLCPSPYTLALLHPSWPHTTAPLGSPPGLIHYQLTLSRVLAPWQPRQVSDILFLCGAQEIVKAEGDTPPALPRGLIPHRWTLHDTFHLCRALTRTHRATLVWHLHRTQATGRWAHYRVTNHRASLQGEAGVGVEADWDPCA